MTLRFAKASFERVKWLLVALTVLLTLKCTEQLTNSPPSSCKDFSVSQVVQGGLILQEFIILTITPESGSMRVFYPETGVEATIGCTS